MGRSGDQPAAAACCNMLVIPARLGRIHRAFLVMRMLDFKCRIVCVEL